ncbi:MAG: ATP synthase F1 subunit delta [Flavobacterium sp.]|nr:ATP synthase F1 subunit delta [Flavobacterium sp.]
MAGTRAAIRYAKAIFDTATDKGSAADVNQDMADIAASISGSGDLQAFLQNPTVSSENKFSTLNEIFSGMSSVSSSLFRLLYENKRLGIISNVATEFNKLYEEKSGVEKAIVTTAVPMDESMERNIMAKASTLSTKKIVLENIVDPEIIGGFILRIGDQQYNASVANKLQMLKRELSN